MENLSIFFAYLWQFLFHFRIIAAYVSGLMYQIRICIHNADPEPEDKHNWGPLWINFRILSPDLQFLYLFILLNLYPVFWRSLMLHPPFAPMRGQLCATAPIAWAGVVKKVRLINFCFVCRILHCECSYFYDWLMVVAGVEILCYYIFFPPRDRLCCGFTADGWTGWTNTAVEQFLSLLSNYTAGKSSEFEEEKSALQQWFTCGPLPMATRPNHTFEFCCCATLGQRKPK